ncbi:UDP-N-acetylmuramate--L-alanine ligase [Vallitalea sp.]|jgi:UDP-N-acetylmuramate--alanine ligase|uniref:UDP-N-acetylmuramate--L-alanine ligase n=1 Tax=Vallitalea sp. TaxID=1882829 RepID=UPI0025E92C5B|nr:UDP-N-acetylmuramate--L-alanine ligase [Vallitalea sp.]MCT4688052.1 UDP-N-acetylmuramate--L-alanine ligase [Vallitalea sp.]
MYTIDFNKPLNVHFIGIGGISMSGLAEILHQKGFKITGSDIKTTQTTKKLEALGINVFLGHRTSNISDDTELVIYTAAVKEDNIEYMTSLEKGIPLIGRAELLGQIMKTYKYPIAVSGTHGKTTTTSMVSHILLQGQKDPTISIGGILNVIDGNIRVGDSDYFVTESCEYCDSFLRFNPFISIILNIEEDHLDYFKDINHIRHSFKSFADKLPNDGYLIINGDIDNYEEIISDLDCNIITYGKSNDNTYYAENIRYNEYGYPIYDLMYNGKKIEEINLQVNGIHNVYNSLAAIAASNCLDVDIIDMKQGLMNFTGTNRRFEYKGNIRGVNVIDDYAHHPTEISATLSAATKYPHNKLWVVFQPHTYSRTKAFLKNFAYSLSSADNIILTDIYSDREKNTGEIHSKDLLSELTKLGKQAFYFSSFDEIETFLLQNCYPNDLLITMGAGDVRIIGEELIKG